MGLGIDPYIVREVDGCTTTVSSRLFFTSGFHHSSLLGRVFANAAALQHFASSASMLGLLGSQTFELLRFWNSSKNACAPQTRVQPGNFMELSLSGSHLVQTYRRP